MYSYLEIITTISTILAIISGTDENMAKKDELWAYMKAHDEETYKKLRHGVMGQLMNLPGKGGRKVAIGAYKLSQKVVGFNQTYGNKVLDSYIHEFQVLEMKIKERYSDEVLSSIN